jgi:DNA polymerase elongation subunit (family B)
MDTQLKIAPRRDIPKFIRDIITQISNMILEKKTYNEIILKLLEIIQDLYSNRISYQDFILTRTVCNYSSENFYLRLFTERLRNQGHPVSSGDKLHFLVINNSSTRLNDKLILADQYNGESIDYDFYIQKLQPHIDRMFQIRFQNTVPKDIFYQRTIRHKPIYLDQPIKLFMKIGDINLFETTVIKACQS